MCKDSTRTPAANENDADTEHHTSAHRQAALIALARELEEIDGLREALDAKRKAYAAKIAPFEELIEEIEARAADEARALGVFDDEYACDCGCTDEEGDSAVPSLTGMDDLFGEPASPSLTSMYDLFGELDSPSDIRRVPQRIVGLRPKRASAVAGVLGALSVGCAVGSVLVAGWTTGKGGR